MKQLVVVFVRHSFWPTRIIIVPHDSDSDERLLFFEIPFMGKFSMTLNPDSMDSDASVVCIKLDDQEYEIINSFLHDLCGCSFNLVDYLTPVAIDSTFMEDIDYEKPSDLQRVYPAQALLLILKDSINPSRSLFQEISKLNSRRITAASIFNIISPYGTHRSIDMLQLMGEEKEDYDMT